MRDEEKGYTVVGDVDDLIFDPEGRNIYSER